ncbi:hypothetical protein LQ948_07445 [Jiella sp. MQZ9-1]|uniref:Uncharacterized protein n=1 Tax=Jiella flava TaxID=2816857 RepID=A0A939FVB1_9HYPH|nr:hypothetical protein [Jiella flava]MBO0662618.1 hypothetical protein [Jiella flava]MCD2471040.1 hypothetical protein [Jiella flava]
MDPGFLSFGRQIRRRVARRQHAESRNGSQKSEKGSTHGTPAHRVHCCCIIHEDCFNRVNSAILLWRRLIPVVKGWIDDLVASVPAKIEFAVGIAWPESGDDIISATLRFFAVFKLNALNALRQVGR